MESKHLAQHKVYSAPEARARCAPLQLDPSPFYRADDELPPESAISTPSSVSAQSPATSFIPRPPSCSSEPSDTNDDNETLCASRQGMSRRGSSTKEGKEKRKRSRVTPDQLVHLERFFAADRSPTAVRRREISDLLGMQERQTQIWRAKAKLQDGKPKGRSSSTEAPPTSPPELITGFEVDLHQLIHEDEPVTIIPCTNLAIGTWQRIASPGRSHDLIAYLCDTKRCLTWFIHSAGYGFKMELAFDTIVDTKFTNAAPGSGMATFTLSQPPIFYLENVAPTLPNGPIVRHWKRCGDWTEGQQASVILRHTLAGSAVQLAHLLRSLNSSSTGGEIPLHSPSYRTAPPSPTADLPQTPLTGFSGSEYSFSDGPVAVKLEEQERERRNSYSGPVTLSYPHTSDYASTQSSVSETFSAADLSGQSLHSTATYDGSVYRDYPKTSPPSGGFAYYYSPTARYPNAAVARNFYDESPSGPSIGIRRHASTTALHYGDRTSSSRLTAPLHPPPQLPQLTRAGSLSASSTPIISGLPAVIYHPDGAVQDQHVVADQS
ncbi:hypothetical protein HGRIS_003679 [Hohenbuehelia grisea]|uniref:Homeobox domain-containing protein n=1 Tax=Hohenbuehelia grisea TaxID=104357 RepID=A0ABR3JGN3_9AGAR